MNFSTHYHSWCKKKYQYSNNNKSDQMKSTNLAFNFKMIRKNRDFYTKILSNTEEVKKGLCAMWNKDCLKSVILLHC